MATCTVSDCDSLVGSKGARGMCPRHYQYWARTGVTHRTCAACGGPLTSSFQKYCSDACKPRCSVDGCDGPVRKRGWCASHYAQAHKYGRDPQPFGYKWAERVPCLVCGQPSAPMIREFCSAACRLIHRSDRPDSVACIKCGVDLDLHERGKRGQRRKRSTKLCSRCRQDYRKHGTTTLELALRDGTDCGICGEPVDLALRRSDSLMCASVDHIIPRARGGTNDPANLQLAHLYCNHVKGDGRKPFASTESEVI